MKKILSLLLILSIGLISKESILQLDTLGHTAKIKKNIIVTKSGDIITASDDKTIRVWSSVTGKEKRKILGQIGAGSGEIFAIALSPDEKWLAVGGYFKYDEIRIYNYPTGELIKVLKSHSNVVNDLAFDSDGKYLISGSADDSAKIWSAKSWKLLDTIEFHTNNVYGVKIIKRGKRYLALTAGDDNQIALYDIKKKKIIKSDKSEYNLNYLATTDKHIAVCGTGKEIRIYDYHLKLLQTIESETTPKGLAYSPDGKLLIAGSLSDYSYEDVNIYNKEKNYKLLTSFKKHTNLTQAVTFLNNTTAISAGGDNNEIYLWDSHTAKVQTKIEGVGATVWSVGVKGESVGWGNDGRDVHNYNSWNIQKNLNLKTMTVALAEQNDKKLKRIPTSQGGFTLTHTKGGDYGYSDATLILKKNQKKIISITRRATDGFRHRCYGFYKEYIISGGANGHLKIYNLKGKEIANLVGHTGEIWSIALDGDRLVSGSSDQTIRVWDLSRVGSDEQITPQLNIFVSKDDEWVVWSKSGYFNASTNGDKYIGFHINQGSNKEAYFLPVDKFYKEKYRPDIIANILRYGSEKRAIMKTKRKTKIQNITDILPPVIKINSKTSLFTTKNHTTIEFEIKSPKHPIDKVTVTHNGRKIATRALVRLQKNRHSQKHTLSVELIDGYNLIEVMAENRYAISPSAKIEVTKKANSHTNIYKPTLYLLSIGVSRYKHKQNNLQYAHKDAHEISKAFQKQEGGLFAKVITKELTDENADRDSILAGLSWIEREATQKDVVVIFIAGHGVNDDYGSYYFMSYEGNPEELRRTAVNWRDFKDIITNIPSKVILLADTCHSGNINGKRDMVGAIKSITSSGTGEIIMTATTGNGYSYEDKAWKNGAFTKALLDGLDGLKADYDNDGSITIKEIDLYITNRVKELTNGRQKPTTILPDSIPDFAIWHQ